MTGLNILLIIVMLATVAVLATGLFAMFRGGEFNAKYSNKLMQARVGFQFLALIIVSIILLAR